MDVNERFEQLRFDTIGRRISFIRLACDILLLYVECKPGDGRGVTFWLNPPWHVSASGRVIAGSDQASGEGQDGATEEDLDRVNKSLGPVLLDRPITAIQVDQRSNDLTLEFTEKTFILASASKLSGDHLWHIRENQTGLKIIATSLGFEVHKGRV